MNPELSIHLFRVVINYSAFIWLSLIIWYSIIVNYPVKLYAVYKSKCICITRNKIILRKSLISLLLLVIFDLIIKFKSNEIIFCILAILSVLIQLLFVLVVIYDLLNISEMTGRKIQRDIFLVGSSNNITNYCDDTARILLNPPLNEPLFFILIIIVWQNSAPESKSHTYFTLHQTRSLLNIIYMLSLASFIVYDTLTVALSVLNTFVHLANNKTYLLTFKVIYLSFVAIGLLLSICYFTLRAILSMVIQLLFVFVVNSGLLIISEFTGQKIQRETYLVGSSNNNTNSGYDTVFRLSNPSPHTLPTTNELHSDEEALFEVLNTSPHILPIKNKSYDCGVALFIYRKLLVIQKFLWLILIFGSLS